MKTQLLVGVAALMMLASCNQNAVDPTTSSSAARAASTAGTSGTGVSGNTEVVITQAQLPAAVGTYLSTNYAGYTFVQAEQGTDRNGATYYEVRFTFNGITKELHFDANGALLSGPRGGHAPGDSTRHHMPGDTAHHHMPGNTEVVITQAQLPADVGTYLSTNYAGYTFVQAEQGTDPSGAAYYEVQFTFNGTTRELHFDANGALLNGPGGGKGPGGHGRGH